MPLRPVIAGMVQVPSGGSITDPGVAYIRSDGNDTTGDGSPSAPYLTAQKAAVTEGFTYLDIGVVNAGPIAWGNNTSRALYIRGRGPGSILGLISTKGGNLTIQDVGVRSVVISQILTSPDTAVVGGNIVVTNVSVSGAITATGGPSAALGTPGGNSGTIVINGQSIVGSASTAGGANNNGGTGGDGAELTVNGPSIVITSLDVSGGTGGTPGADGDLVVRQGASVPTPTPDAAGVAGAVINNVWFDNTYP